MVILAAMRLRQLWWLLIYLIAPPVRETLGELPGIYLGEGATLKVHGQVEVTQDDGKQALRFVEDGSFLLVQTKEFWPEFTLSIWAKPTYGPQGQHLAMQRLDAEDPQFRIIGGETNPAHHGFFRVPANGGDFTFPAGQWNHMILRRDKSGHSLFLNGKKILGGPSAIGYAIDPAPFSIGAETGGHNRWRGLVRDIALVNYAVTDDVLDKLATGADAAQILGRDRNSGTFGRIVIFAGLAAVAGYFIRRGWPLLGPWFRSYKVSIATGSAGLLATITAVYLLSDYVHKHDREQFESEILTRRTIIDGTVTINTQVMEQIAAMIAGNPELGSERWEHLVKQSDAVVHYEGMHEMGFLKKVHAWEWPEYQQRFEFAANAAPSPFQGWLHLPLHYHSYIVHPEAPAESSPWVGTDLAGDAEISSYALKVMTSGNTQSTPIYFENVNGLKRARIRIFVPVHNPRYIKGRVLESGADHLDNLNLDSAGATIDTASQYMGTLYLTLDVHRMIHSMYGFQKSDVGFEIFSDRLGTLEPANRYLISHPTELPAQPYFEAVLPLRVYFTRWYLKFYTLPRFEQRSLRHWPWYVGAVGSVCTLLVTLLVGVQTRARVKEESISAELRQHFLERERISRDLHDGAIQSVFVLGIGLQRAVGMLPDKADLVKERLSASIHSIQEIIEELRGALLGLKRKESHPLTLDAVLRRYIELLKNNTPIQLAVRIDGALPQVDHDTSFEVLNIVREAVTNSLRHAGATQIEISARTFRGQLMVTVEDNGKGFNPGKNAGQGHGLSNMEARAEELGGGLQIESKPGRTSVQLSFPVRNVQSGPRP